METVKPIIAGEVVRLSPLVRRVTAPNPGMMTGPGTNTYIVGNDVLAVIDPGPVSEPHFDRIRELVGDRLRWILCTHTHLDHSPGARALQAATGAQTIGMPAPPHGSQDVGFFPDRIFKHGEVIEGGDFALRGIHTPGHASNHLCFLLEPEKLLFTGDHIMQGSTVVITPPDGNMIEYLQSLDSLLTLDVVRVAPGHGHPIETPHDEARRLIAHRLKREQKIIAAFSGRNPATIDDLVPVAYADTSPKLHAVARRSLHAHLIKLERDGQVRQVGEHWTLRS
jgi:glyoxylase-like metal-dependent hydrolase (beta-lactamase superfamily II)